MISFRIALAGILLVPSISVSQKYHGPMEILKLMEASKMTYVLASLEPSEVEIIPAPIELDHGLFLKSSPGGGLVLTSFGREYGDSQAYVVNFNNAERAFNAESLKLAREYYLSVLEVAPNQSQVMTFIGQTYEHEKDFAAAIDWYHKAIETNYYDYAAHWFLADCLEFTGHQDEALKEILLARVLNRTNTRLTDAFESILKRSNLRYLDWSFRPKYEVKGLGGNKVSVKWEHERSEWLPYALCKALWQFEPGYRDSMVSGSNERPIVIEEKECLLNVIAGLKNSGKDTKDASLQTANNALSAKMFTEYIVYEVILPAHPSFVFNLSRSFLDSVTDYVIKFRTQPN